MNGFLLVGAGGALGAMARFGFSSVIGRLWPMGFPLATLLINIIGFVPLGLALRAYWTLVRPIQRPALVTTALGLAVSLTIELLQSVIPTRNSGTTDLFTNSLGTYLGFLLYASAPAQMLVTRLYGSPSETGIC